MLDIFGTWIRRYFSDPQAVLLMVILILSFTIVLTMGGMLLPLLAALVIAYLLEALVQVLQHLHLPRIVAVVLVYVIFIAALAFIVLGLIPLLSRQLSQFVHDLPHMINNGQQLLLRLPELYPQFITGTQVSEVITGIRKAITGLGQNILSLSLASIPTLITVLVYLILSPLLVFFFLKDKDKLMAWLVRFLPRKRSLLTRVWQEMDQQMGNYIRGKFYEILIVGVATWVTFTLMGLAYASLLAALVGLSVIVPYIGATVVTLPVALVGYFQWGLSVDFGWIMLAYGIIQALDGNLLVPLLFSETVNLHPVAIITAVLVFGGLWGIWGVFFAIPLATLVKAIINAWPRGEAPTGP